MKSYRDLEVFKQSKQLAIEVHKMTLSLPKFEMFEEGSQTRRSAKAITSLIVEGYGRRRYKADFIKYLVYAQSECDETIVHLEFLFETGSLQDEIFYELIIEKYLSLSRQINKFIQWVEKNMGDFSNSTNRLTIAECGVAGFRLLNSRLQELQDTSYRTHGQRQFSQNICYLQPVTCNP